MVWSGMWLDDRRDPLGLTECDDVLAVRVRANPGRPGKNPRLAAPGLLRMHDKTGRLARVSHAPGRQIG